MTDYHVNISDILHVLSRLKLLVARSLFINSSVLIHKPIDYNEKTLIPGLAF